MKKALLATISIVVFANICISQSLNLGIQLGGGLIDFDSKAISIGGAIDFKPKKIPIAVSPYFERFAQTGQSRAYYGANILITNKIDSHLYIGTGIGNTKWKVDTYSRDALTYNFILGLRLRLSGRVGIFLEGKYFLNSQTDKDTELFNSQSADTPAFLFDNDIFLSAGLIIKII